MTRTAALLVSLAIGAAAIFGVFAVSRTLSLGNHSRAATETQIVARTKQLARYEASLRQALARKPPAPPSVASGNGAIPTAQPIRVVYHRPPPIVIHKHRAGGGDDGYEVAQGAGADD
jgi:hypothetical protein